MGEAYREATVRSYSRLYSRLYNNHCFRLLLLRCRRLKERLDATGLALRAVHGRGLGVAEREPVPRPLTSLPRMGREDKAQQMHITGQRSKSPSARRVAVAPMKHELHLVKCRRRKTKTFSAGRAKACSGRNRALEALLRSGHIMQVVVLAALGEKGIARSQGLATASPQHLRDDKRQVGPSPALQLAEHKLSVVEDLQ